MADNYPQAPSVDASGVITQEAQSFLGTFPDLESLGRINDYDYHRKLFMGEHFEAFRVKIDDERFNRAYNRLRYVAVNFAGLISKIVADMLFGEPIVVKVPDGDQDFVDAFWAENQMDVQCYESALSNSYNGDAVFKTRIGQRNPGSSENSTVITEDIMPKLYFPVLDPFNVRATPKEKVLAWTFKKGDKIYLRKEIHTPGLITNKIFEMQGNKIVQEVGLDVLGPVEGLYPQVPTGIDRSLITHVVNWKTGDRHFGLSDYYDLDSIFYAINNRISKVDNILDKHGDPILMLPPGILDEKGHVKKKALGVIEMGEGENNKPEYIVWDAKLESAFSEIEKLVDFMYLIGEISPDILGIGEGKSESGRALKYKLMRTIAKVSRKKLYYDLAIKDVVYTAQLFAKANNVAVGGLRLKGEPVMPEIEWSDGLPNDIREQLENETMAIDAGLTSKKSAMMRIYGVDEVAADQMMKDMEMEMPKVQMPLMKIGQNDKVVDPKTGKPPK